MYTHIFRFRRKVNMMKKFTCTQFPIFRFLVNHKFLSFRKNFRKDQIFTPNVFTQSLIFRFSDYQILESSKFTNPNFSTFWKLPNFKSWRFDEKLTWLKSWKVHKTRFYDFQVLHDSSFFVYTQSFTKIFKMGWNRHLVRDKNPLSDHGPWKI